MRIYNVIFSHIDYSDTSFDLLGSFSSKEKAAAYIEKKCWKPKEEDIQQEFDEWYAAENKKRKEENLKQVIEALPFWKKDLENKIEAKKYHNQVNWGISAIKMLENYIANAERIIKEGGQDQYVSPSNIKAYISWKYPHYNEGNLSIEEHELDEEK